MDAKEENIRSIALAPCCDISRIGEAQGSGSSGRASDVRSCTYMSEHTAEVRGFERGRIHQRQECNHHSKEVWRSSEEFHRRGILGKRLLRIDSRIS